MNNRIIKILGWIVFPVSLIVFVCMVPVLFSVVAGGDSFGLIPFGWALAYSMLFIPFALIQLALTMMRLKTLDTKDKFLGWSSAIYLALLLLFGNIN